MKKEDYKKQLDLINKNLEVAQTKAIRYYQGYNILKNLWDNSTVKNRSLTLKEINNIKKQLKNLIL